MNEKVGHIIFTVSTIENSEVVIHFAGWNVSRQLYVKLLVVVVILENSTGILHCYKKL